MPTVTWQQHVMGYWQEGAASAVILLSSTSDAMGQHKRIGGITFGAGLIAF